MNANLKLPLVYLLFLYTFISNKPLCEVTPTVPRGILPSPYVHIVTHKQSEKYQVWSDKTPGGAFPVTPYITFISYRHPHPTSNILGLSAAPLQLKWLTVLLNGISTVYHPHLQPSYRHILENQQRFLTRVCRESSFALWTSESSFSMMRGNRNCSKT